MEGGEKTVDSTELHYVDYDAEQTWDEMLRAYIEAGGDILYPGDEKEMLLRAALAIATAIMAKVDSALRMDTLTYATGEYLKEYGRKRNCVYIEAIPATAPVTMTFQATGIAHTIAAGTELTADGAVIFATQEDLSITGTAQEINTTVQCQTPGIIGNGLRQGTQLQFVEGIDGFVSAIVTADASGGVDAEDEEVYRERIRNFGLVSVTTGPKMLYESQTLAVSSQIVDAKAVNDGGGEVGIYIILAEGANENAIKASVEQALSSDTKRPLTDHVTVYVSDEAAYTLNVKVWYSQYAGISDSVTAAISEYQAWQDNKIGRAFNPDKLIAMLYQAGCERVQFLEGSGLGDDPEAAAYTEINSTKHCAGTITLTVVNS